MELGNGKGTAGQGVTTTLEGGFGFRKPDDPISLSLYGFKLELTGVLAG